MARYRMGDGTVVDTEKASSSWEEDTRWDGRNHISVATGSQWHHQRLYRSRKGRYYIEHESQYQGSTPSVEWVSPEEACRWLVANDHNPEDEDFPVDLRELVEQVTE